MPEGDVKRINTFLELVVHQKGSDLHLVSGQPPRIRLYGDLIPIKYRALSAEETTALVAEAMTDEVRQAFETRYSLDFAYEVPGLARFPYQRFSPSGWPWRRLPRDSQYRPHSRDVGRTARTLHVVPRKKRPHPRHRANGIGEIHYPGGHDRLH